MPSSQPLLTIGAVAERSGIADSGVLRFYERRGLISAVRSEGGQRRYHRDVLRRLAVIRSAQHVGFTLEDIAAMLSRFPADRRISEADWRTLSATWAPQLNERIRTLERVRDQLDRCIGCGCLSMASCQMANPGDAAGERGPGPRFWQSP